MKYIKSVINRVILLDEYRLIRIREANSGFYVKNELINDLKVAINKIISEYKRMGISRGKMTYCIDEVCKAVKKNIETGYY